MEHAVEPNAEPALRLLRFEVNVRGIELQGAGKKQRDDFGDVLARALRERSGEVFESFNALSLCLERFFAQFHQAGDRHLCFFPELLVALPGVL